MAIYLTTHLKERYLERFINKKRYDHLANCQTESCKHCVSLIYELKRASATAEIKKEIFERLDKAREIRSYMNNTEFMARCYERYGYRRFEFLVDDDALFVIIHDEGKKIAVTVMYSKFSVVGNIVNRPKFKKQQPA